MHSITNWRNITRKKEIVKRLSQKLVDVGNLELVETGTTADLITSSGGQLEIYNSIAPELTIQQQPKLVRYINGQTITAEQWQIQDWPSDTKPNTYLSPREKRNLEKEILLEIQSHTAYLLLFPKKEIPWWQKIAAMF